MTAYILRLRSQYKTALMSERVGADQDNVAMQLLYEQIEVQAKRQGVSDAVIVRQLLDQLDEPVSRDHLKELVKSHVEAFASIGNSSIPEGRESDFPNL